MDTRMRLKLMLMRILGKDPSWKEERGGIDSAVIASFVRMSIFGLIALFTVLFIMIYYKYAIFSAVAVIACFIIMIWFVLGWATITCTSYVLRELEKLVDEADKFDVGDSDD